MRRAFSSRHCGAVFRTRQELQTWLERTEQVMAQTTHPTAGRRLSGPRAVSSGMGGSGMAAKLWFLTGSLFLLSGVLIVLGLPDPRIIEPERNIVLSIGPLTIGAISVLIGKFSQNRVRVGLWDILMVGVGLILVTISSGILNCNSGLFELQCG